MRLGPIIVMSVRRRDRVARSIMAAGEQVDDALGKHNAAMQRAQAVIDRQRALLRRGDELRLGAKAERDIALARWREANEALAEQMARVEQLESQLAWTRHPSTGERGESS